MKLFSKSTATSLTAFTFLVMAITGIMMYFHLFDAYTKDLHEILGLAFVAIVILHVYFNWKSMKSYFTKKIFLVSFLLVSAVSLGFILTSETGENPKKTLIVSMLNAPLENSLAILSDDKDEAIMKLENAGLKTNGAKSIKDLAKMNNVSPFKVVSTLNK